MNTAETVHENLHETDTDNGQQDADLILTTVSSLQMFNFDSEEILHRFDAETFKDYLSKLTKFINDEEKVDVSPRTERSEKLAAAYNLRGLIKYKLVNFYEAQEDYTKAIKYHVSPLYYYNRGTISYRMGYMDKAMADFNKCMEIDPAFAEGLIAIERVKSTHCSLD